MKKEKKTKNEEKKQNTVSHEEHEELKEMLKRMHAEFQNYRKRTEDEKTKFIKLSTEDLIKKLIPILDNFELALKHNTEKTEFSEGMEMIYTQLLQTLEDEGLQKIPATGKFDPKIHEAVMVENTNDESGKILQELQKGYKINDKVIRNSKVKISKKNR